MDHDYHEHEGPELWRFLGRMEAKLDNTLEWMKRHQQEDDLIRQRLGTIEKVQARNLGVAAGVSFVVSMAAAIISYTLVFP
jgi:hypothetical protein